MVNVYALNIENLPDPAEHANMLEHLTPARKEKTMKYRHASDRKRSLGAGLLLLDVLPKFGADSKDIQIAADGKPEVDGIFFNLSHSGSYVICAVGKQPIGCDVEQVKKAPRQVAKHFFCESEIAYIEMQESRLQDEAFFRIWTMKESYMKMTGEGIRLPLNEFEILLCPQTGVAGGALNAYGAITSFEKLTDIEGECIRVRREGKVQPCCIECCELPGYQVSVCFMESDLDRDLDRDSAQKVEFQEFSGLNLLANHFAHGYSFGV